MPTRDAGETNNFGNSLPSTNAGQQKSADMQSRIIALHLGQNQTGMFSSGEAESCDFSNNRQTQVSTLIHLLQEDAAKSRKDPSCGFP